MLILSQLGQRTVTAVGDPDQAIYGWRAAKSRVFEAMQDDYPKTKVINLEENYRSTFMIVRSASHVIVQGSLYVFFFKQKAYPPILNRFKTYG